MISTQDSLRDAMNNLAHTIDPLDSAAVLRSGRRQRTRRRLAGTAGIVAAVLVVAGGIAVLRPTTTGGVVATSGTAIRDLDNSLDGLTSGNYSFSRTGVRGLADVSEARIDVTRGFAISFSGTLSLVRVGKALYLRSATETNYADPQMMIEVIKEDKDLTPEQIARIEDGMAQLDGKRWLRVDRQRLTAAAEDDDLSTLDYLGPEPTTSKPDITGAAELIGAVTTASRAGDTITGTLDATKPSAPLGDPETLTAEHGLAAKAIGFRATLDGQGRLTRFEIEMPGSVASQPPGITPEPTAPASITITGYGDVPAPQEPAGAEKILDITYDLVSGDID